MVKVSLPKIKEWTVAFDFKFDLAFFSIGTGVNVRFGNLTSALTLALSSSQGGQLAPMITDLGFEAESRHLNVENYFWFGDLVEHFLNIGEKVAKLATIEFGIPLANFALPTLSQMVFQT